MQSAYAVTVILFAVPSPTSITPVACQAFPVIGRETMICTFAGSAALLFAAAAPPPSSTVPAGQDAVAVAVVCICGPVETAEAETICELVGPAGPCGPTGP